MAENLAEPKLTLVGRHVPTLYCHAILMRSPPFPRLIRRFSLPGVTLAALVSCADAAGPASGLRIEPNSVELTLGDTVRVSAVLIDESGGRTQPAEVAWTTLDAAVARVDSTGLVRAVGGGSTQIVAVVGDLAASARVLVPDPQAGFPVQNGLTFFFDPRDQSDTRVRELEQDIDVSCDFVGGTSFISDPASILLDGDGDYCRTPSIPSTLGFGSSDNEHTLFVVVKPTLSGIVDSYVLDRPKNRADIIYGYLADQFEYFVEGLGFSGDNPRTGSVISASVGQWQTIAYTVGADGSNKQRGYKNGTLVVGPLNKSFDLDPQDGSITLGNSSPGGNEFTGQIAHVFWWNRQLSDSEILDVHNWVRDQGGFSGLLP